MWHSWARLIVGQIPQFPQNQREQFDFLRLPDAGAGLSIPFLRRLTFDLSLSRRRFGRGNPSVIGDRWIELGRHITHPSEYDPESPNQA